MNQTEYIKELHDREIARLLGIIDDLQKEIARLKKKKVKKKAVRVAAQNGEE